MVGIVTYSSTHTISKYNLASITPQLKRLLSRCFWDIILPTEACPPLSSFSLLIPEEFHTGISWGLRETSSLSVAMLTAQMISPSPCLSILSPSQWVSASLWDPDLPVLVPAYLYLERSPGAKPKGTWTWFSWASSLRDFASSVKKNHLHLIVQEKKLRLILDSSLCPRLTTNDQHLPFSTIPPLVFWFNLNYLLRWVMQSAQRWKEWIVRVLTP